MRRVLLAPVLFALAACPEPAPPELLDLTVSLTPPEFGYQVVTEPVRVEPYDEAFVCSVVRVEPEADELLVWGNRLESLSSTSTHHMNVYIGRFSFLDAFLEEGSFENQLGVGLGTHDCSDLGNLMSTASPVFPSQRENQQITMPDGVGIPLVAPLVLVMEHHYLNLREEPALINAALNIERMAPEDVAEVASLIFDTVPGIEVEPGGQKVAARTCAMDREVQLALVSTHNHQRTDCATINHYDGISGTVDEDPFFVNKLWETPPILHFPRETMRIAAGDGVHWACHYRDWRGDGIVDDGTAQGEMCVFAAVAYPAARSRQEIESILGGDDILAVYSLLDDMMGDCADHPEVQGPWAYTDEAFFGDRLTTCDGYEQTHSNVLD